jgi:Mce-associated membrane protein
MTGQREIDCAPVDVDELEATDVAAYSASIDGDDARQPQIAEESPRPSRLVRAVGYVLLPTIALALTGAAGYLKYQDSVTAETNRVREQSVQLAREATVDLLSYTPDNAEAKLNAASDRLTGSFRDSYLSLVRDVVIPGAKQKKISANAVVAAGASVSASTDTAKVMVFVNQTVTVGNEGPTDTASVVVVDLEKVGDRWLISRFEPR